ncbi:uncharacterized protein PG998_010307 [Apiospora kogelbergensis]|uniref:uncharacterized protein n=1 Tax=Apiospora kogelbergensis TaxID=1337665 RepID=UPI0031308584
MAPNGICALAALLLLGLGKVEAEQIVWSSFAYILHGERTPLSTSSLKSSLTTYGAQQLYAQGQVFRDRYLTNASDGNITNSFPIVNLSPRALDNSQLDIITTTDTYNVASAMAFMQGLYPPTPRAFVENDGGRDASTLANGSLVNFPLDGYQYPNIQATSILDPKSFQIQGHVSCSTYMGSQLMADDDEIIRRNRAESAEMYDGLRRGVFAGTEPFASTPDADHAYELWDYAGYQHAHNATVRAGLGADVLDRLHRLASDQQFDYNGNLSASGLQPGDMVRAVAGRTLAARVAAQLRSQVAGGYPHKLSLAFGTFEPMLAFFALAQLSEGPASLRFRTIPAPGSAMVFELFSVADDDGSGGSNDRAQRYPGEDDLWVRFLYRYGTSANEPLVEYPIFGRGNSQSSMKWRDFRSAMSEVAVADLYHWCQMCSAPTLYCMATAANADGGDSFSWPGASGASMGRNRMTPVLGGAIGALVTLGVVALAGLAAFFLGGLRVRHRSDHYVDRAVQRTSSLGGFKGAEKMASDKDLSVARGGGRHERVGSWEMGGPSTTSAAPPHYSSRDAGTPFGATVERKLNDDGVSIMEEEPVKPREAV